MGLRGPQPGPEKIRKLIAFTPEVWDWLEEKAAKRGDRSGVTYLMRNVEKQYKEDQREGKK